MKIYFRWPSISVRREQAFLSGGKNKKWEEGNNKMRGKRRRMLKKKKNSTKATDQFRYIKI